MPDRDLLAEGRSAQAKGAAAWSLWRAANCAELLDELESLRTRVDELAATRDPDDDVLVEGSWFRPADLPLILGNYMRFSDEYARKWKGAMVDLHAASVRIAELEATGVAQGSDWMAKANRDSLRSLLDTVAEAQSEPLPPPWRCMGTTTMANAIPGDDRAVWCTLPRGHAGMHHGEISQWVPTGIEGFSKAEPIGLDWPEVSDR